MPVVRYVVCDECGDAHIKHSKLDNPDDDQFVYGEIIDSGEPQFAEVEGWTVKAEPNPDDPIAVEFEYYCPGCGRVVQ